MATKTGFVRQHCWVHDMKTEHFTGRSTHAYFSRCAPYISRFIQCTCTGSRLESSNQHVSRLLKTLRLLHSHSSISCLVATSCACLGIVLLFLLDWRRNRGSLASIPAAVAGLAERPSKQSPLTGYEPKNLIEISSQHFTEKDFQCRLQRRAHHCYV